VESTYPSAPGDILVFENDRVRLWSMTLEPGFVLFQTVGTAEPRTPHRIRNVGDTTVTHYISERSPGEKRLPGETNGRGTFVDGNSGVRA
jgi:hypothetical protein